MGYPENLRLTVSVLFGTFELTALLLTIFHLHLCSDTQQNRCRQKYILITQNTWTQFNLLSPPPCPLPSSLASSLSPSLSRRLSSFHSLGLLLSVLLQNFLLSPQTRLTAHSPRRVLKFALCVYVMLEHISVQNSIDPLDPYHVIKDNKNRQYTHESIHTWIWMKKLGGHVNLPQTGRANFLSRGTIPTTKINAHTMGWLRIVGSWKLYVSFAEYRRFYRALLQKRPIILRRLLIVATPYHRNRALQCAWAYHTPSWTAHDSHVLCRAAGH